MRLVYISNANNNHHKPLADEFMKICGGDFAFVAMTPSSRNHVAIIQNDSKAQDLNYEPYVLRAYESPEMMSEAQRVIDGAECVIVGGNPGYLRLVSDRLRRGKMTFLYSERLFKGPAWKDFLRFLKYRRLPEIKTPARKKHSKFYLLCSSAFSAWDYNLCGLFRNKSYRWGYFPETRSYDDIDGLISRKKKASILWAGRFVDWKHPEFAVKLAENLHAMNFDISVKIIGAGGMQKELAAMIKPHGNVEIVGAMPSGKLRSEMENSQIFLFTSSKKEGWGAVLNEAMNSGCAVIAGSKIGSVPYLIHDGDNGIIFRDSDIDDLTRKAAGLLRDPERMQNLGRNAYRTVTGEWSPRNAAKRFMALCEALRESDAVSLWQTGPGSPAPVKQ